ncbi:MAG: hypothetical protein M3461_18130 [Pseudomonadota bacterium]|nr:hypothetical protein [Pseudomonadota bacterium]
MDLGSTINFVVVCSPVPLWQNAMASMSIRDTVKSPDGARLLIDEELDELLLATPLCDELELLDGAVPDDELELLDTLLEGPPELLVGEATEDALEPLPRAARDDELLETGSAGSSRLLELARPTALEELAVLGAPLVEELGAGSAGPASGVSVGGGSVSASGGHGAYSTGGQQPACAG